jgi:effector-binding domain-containing protein
MEIKKISPMNVLCYQQRTTINQLFRYVRVVARQLYTQAHEHDLEITGPIYWIYYGMDGHPDTEFTLKVALPVQECKPVSGGFACEQLEAFICISALHTDVWENMPHTYEKMITYIQQNGYQMNGICREIYIHIDFNNPQNSITEVQIGIIV